MLSGLLITSITATLRMNQLTHRFFFFSFLTLLCLTACQNEEPTIGNDVINQGALINTSFTDTLTLEVSIEERAPLELLQTQSSGFFLFGNLNDPTFGESKAEIYTQLSPGINNLQFDSLPSLDSIVLTLAFPSATQFFYGNNDDEQVMEVFEIDVPNPIERQSAYTTDIGYDLKQKLGEASFRFPEDASSETRLNIRLDNDFGTQLIEKSQRANDTTYNNIANFLDYFNGIALIPGTDNSSIGFFDLKSSISQMVIYYKALYPVTTSIDGELEYAYGERSRSFELRDFVIGNVSTVATSVNRFSHDYTGTPVSDALSNETASEIAYLQGMEGIQMRVRIPHLQNLGNIIVNGATLEVIGLEEEADSFFRMAPSLELRLDPQDVAENDIFNFTYLDYLRATSGVVETDSITDETIRKYELPVPFSIQRMLTEAPGERDMIIRIPESGRNYITGTSQFVNPYRALVGGPEHPNYPMKLKLYYTEVQ